MEEEQGGTLYNAHAARFGIFPGYIFELGYAKYLKASSIMLLAYLCVCANKKRRAFPSTEKMSELFDTSRQTILRSLRELEHYGVITIERPRVNGRGRKNTYLINDAPGRPDFSKIRKKTRKRSL